MLLPVPMVRSRLVRAPRSEPHCFRAGPPHRLPHIYSHLQAGPPSVRLSETRLPASRSQDDGIARVLVHELWPGVHVVFSAGLPGN